MPPPSCLSGRRGRGRFCQGGKYVWPFRWTGLGRVIAALHREPGRNWTLADMAREMGSSRSVFAKRFVEVTGVTPQRYVLALRMRLAEQWFRRDKLAIDTAARRLGFGSQAAFARAFKRIVGEPPGKARRKATALRG